MDIIKSITNQIVEKYQPEKVILFGSVARRMHTEDSDIDLCVVLECEDTRKTAVDMQVDLETHDKAVDLILYIPEKWEEFHKIPGHFAHLINEEGEVLYAR